MIPKLFIFAGLLLILSCQSLKSPEEPSELIEEDRMVEILTEIALLKAAKGSFKKKMELEKINPEAYILQKYGIDSIIFAQNNAWYTSDLKNYEKVFTKVKASIESSQKILEKEQKEKDSLKRVNDSIKKFKEKLKQDSLKITKKNISKNPTAKALKNQESKKSIAKYISEKKKQFP